MARRRRKSHRTSRRRRIGAMKFDANNPLVKYGSIAAGFFFADKINPLIDKVTGTLDPKIVGAAQAGLGSYYIFMHKGKKSLPITLVAGVVAGSGIKRAMTAFGIGRLLAGYGSVPVIGRTMAGYKNVPVIGAGTAGNGYIAAFNVPKPMNVMGNNGSGSGITNSGGGSMMD